MKDVNFMQQRVCDMSIEELKIAIKKKQVYNNCKVKSKKQAIRWIRLARDKHRTFYCLICEEFNCSCGSSECYKIKSLEEITAWLICFFHITAEERK